MNLSTPEGQLRLYLLLTALVSVAFFLFGMIAYENAVVHYNNAFDLCYGPDDFYSGPYPDFEINESEGVLELCSGTACFK